MRRQLAFLFGIAVIVGTSWAQDQSLEGVTSYPVNLEPEEVVQSQNSISHSMGSISNQVLSCSCQSLARKV
jgi:hypothetical protein